MRRMVMILSITVLASFSNACVASRKFVRTEVKTSSDQLNARIDQNKSEIGEVRDGVSRVDTKVTAVDGRVSQLDAKTNERFDGVKGAVGAVDQKAAQAQSSATQAQSSADRAANDVTALDSKFQNRNLFAVSTEKAILFGFDSAKLDSKYQAELEETASLLEKNPDALIVLEGRTDAKGDKDYNVKLGERRVESVKRYLAVEKGIPIYRIHEISFGSAKPVAPNDSREGREKNRAVVVTILVPKAGVTAATKNQNQNQ